MGGLKRSELRADASTEFRNRTRFSNAIVRTCVKQLDTVCTVIRSRQYEDAGAYFAEGGNDMRIGLIYDYDVGLPFSPFGEG